MSVVLGSRLLQGAARVEGQPDHTAGQRRRATYGGTGARGHAEPGGDQPTCAARASVWSGYRRSERTRAAQIREQFAAVGKQGAEQVLVDLRGTAEGGLDHGIAAARLFVARGVLATRESRAGKTPIQAESNDGGVAPPALLLVDNGTSGAAEVFAAALTANGRTTLIGERTLGRAATQELVKLPDGSGLWLSTTRYLTPKDAVIHEKGLKPDVLVESPDVEFGAEPPADGSDSREGNRGRRSQAGRLSTAIASCRERSVHRRWRSCDIAGPLPLRAFTTPSMLATFASGALNPLTRVDRCRITRLALPRTARRAARAASGGFA